MTPYEIGVLLHYYARCDDHEDVRRKPPIWHPTIEAFIASGLLRYLPASERDDWVGATYEIGARGRAYCEALQRVPLPVQAWILPEHIDEAHVLSVGNA